MKSALSGSNALHHASPRPLYWLNVILCDALLNWTDKNPPESNLGIIFEILIFLLFVYLCSILLGKEPSDCHCVYD